MAIENTIVAFRETGQIVVMHRWLGTIEFISDGEVWVTKDQALLAEHLGWEIQQASARDDLVVIWRKNQFDIPEPLHD